MPVDLWKAKTPAQLQWGNHVHMIDMLKISFGKGEKIESIEFKQTPGYYMCTSLSGHFPSEHPLAYAPNLSKLKIDPAVKRMLKKNKKHVPRLSAKEFNENFFVKDEQVPAKPEGTWWWQLLEGRYKSLTIGP